MSTKHIALGAVAGLLVGGTAVGLMYNYPKNEVADATYCLVCAQHEERYHEATILGAEGSYRNYGGALHALLEPAVGEHAHRWIPRTQVFPTRILTDTSTQAGARRYRIAELEVLERERPHDIALLDAAVREDRARGVRFIQRLLDPTESPHLLTAIRELDRPGTWDERWAAVDRFLAQP